jgi:hypothetical protein
MTSLWCSAATTSAKPIPRIPASSRSWFARYLARTSRDAAFARELVECAIEREQDVGRRREAELAVALEPAPLRRDAQRNASADAALEERASREDNGTIRAKWARSVV